MATKRVTISVPVDIAKRLKGAAGGGSVSEYVTKAIARALEEEQSREALLEFIDSVPKSAEDRRWAKEAFEAMQSGKPMKPKRQRRGKAA